MKISRQDIALSTCRILSTEIQNLKEKYVFIKEKLTVSLLVEYLWEYECEDESDVWCLVKWNFDSAEWQEAWTNKSLGEQILDNVCHSCFEAEHSGNWFMLSQHDVRITALLSVIGTFRQCWAKYSSTEQIIHQMNMNGKSIPFIAIKVR